MSPAIAWISSTITVRSPPSAARPLALVSRMYSDSGVVTRMCGGRFASFARSLAGVSPVRTATRISGNGSPRRGRVARELGERRLEVAVDVVRQRLERRDVEDRRAGRERAGEPAPHQVVEAREERGERLARAGRRGDQDVLAGRDPRPARALRLGRRAEPLAEPSGDQRMEGVEHVPHS